MPPIPRALLRQGRGRPLRHRRGPRRVHGRERLLGAEGGALVVLAGPCQAARHRQAHRRRHARVGGRQPAAEGRAAEGLRPPGAEQGHARRADRPDQRHRDERAGGPLQGHPRARLRVLPRQLRRCRGQARRRVLHPALRGAAAGGDARTLQGPRLRPLLRLRRHVRAVRDASSRSTAGGSATSPSTARRATTSPGGWPR